MTFLTANQLEHYSGLVNERFIINDDTKNRKIIMGYDYINEKGLEVTL